MLIPLILSTLINKYIYHPVLKLTIINNKSGLRSTMSPGVIFQEKSWHSLLYSQHWNSLEQNTAVWPRPHPNPDIFLVSRRPHLFQPTGRSFSFLFLKCYFSWMIKICKPKLVLLTLQTPFFQVLNQSSPRRTCSCAKLPHSGKGTLGAPHLLPLPLPTRYPVLLILLPKFLKSCPLLPTLVQATLC